MPETERASYITSDGPGVSNGKEKSVSGPTKKSEFKNVRDHHIGVVVKREDGKMKGIAIPPDGMILLDEDEQMATANAPRQEGDNPFINGDLELVQSARALANRRPIGDTEHPQQEVGGQVAGEAPPVAEQEAVGAGSDDEEGDATADSSDEPQAPAEEPEAVGKRERTQEESEASARAASARRRAPAANEGATPPPAPPGGHTGSAPAPEGKPVEGKAAPAEEVGTPQAVPSE